MPGIHAVEHTMGRILWPVRKARILQPGPAQTSFEKLLPTAMR